MTFRTALVVVESNIVVVLGPRVILTSPSTYRVGVEFQVCFTTLNDTL